MKVTVTGYVWEITRAPIPVEAAAELWFRPKEPGIVPNLMSAREVQAAYTPSTGFFTVDLESEPGVLYQPFVRWLASPDDPRVRARQYEEWPYWFYPDIGGNISDLLQINTQSGMVFIGTPSVGVRYQLQFDPNTDDLYQRRVL